MENVMHVDFDISRSGCAIIRGLACLSVLYLVAGCGPIRSTQQINEAEVAFERARVAEAASNAPYKFFRAQLLLHKAKEEWGYSEFETSYEYAEEAEDAARAAMRRSEEDPWSDPIDARGRTYQLKPYQTLTAEDVERQLRELDASESEDGGAREEREKNRQDRDGAER